MPATMLCTEETLVSIFLPVDTATWTQKEDLDELSNDKIKTIRHHFSFSDVFVEAILEATLPLGSVWLRSA